MKITRPLNNEFEQLKKQADEKYKLGELEGALITYLEILDYIQSDIDVIRNIISIYAQIGNSSQFIEFENKYSIEIKNDAICQYFLGLLHRKKNFNSKALIYLENALVLGINPDIVFLEVFEILIIEKKFDEASNVLNEWEQVSTNIVSYNLKRAELYGCLRDWESATLSLRKILLEQPAQIEAIVAMAKACIELQHYDDAFFMYDKGINFFPDEPYFYTLKGKLYDLLGMNEKAIQQFDCALNRDTNFLWASVEKSASLIKLKLYNQAIEILDNVISEIPEYVEALFYKASALYEIHDFDSAHKIYAQLEVLGQPLGIFYQGVIELLLGGYDTGWKKYEYRKLFQQSDVDDVCAEIPQWDGIESIHNKAVIVRCEQGLGDNIQFIRYLSVLKKSYNCHITVFGPDVLSRLFNEYNFIDQFIVSSARVRDFEKSIDFKFDLLSLPYLCQKLVLPQPDIQNITINPALYSAWSNRLLEHSGKTKIGIVWFGNSHHENNLNRSINLEDFFKALPPEFDYFILSNDVSSEDQKLINSMQLEGWSLHQYCEFQIDLYETAAYISQLDLVISVDTSLAHLSATLGLETWILLPFTPDFRWQLVRPDSDWYASAVLFRQENMHDGWQKVLANVYARVSRRFE